MNYYPSTANDNPSGAPARKMEIDVFAKFDFHKYANYDGRDLFKRIQHWGDFINELKKYKLFLYSRRTMSPPGTECYGMDEYGDMFYGLNFASADYLGLSQSSLSKEAAQKAAEEYGVNSCGSPLAFGAHKYYYQLMAELQEFWGFKHVILYSAGWLAGFGVIKGLIKTNDHVIMDELAHNCLTEGARAATKNVYRVKHLCNKSMEAKIKEIREQNPNNAILVVTEGLFSMDADTTDIPELQQICKKYEAFLLIDSAHDFGCMGPTGKGCWEGLKDFSNVILMSGGSKCLSTNLGWVACNNECVTEFLKVSSSAYMFTNAVNPVQCATALAQLRILKSETGRRIREKCIENYKYTRKRLEDLGIECRG